MSDSKIKTHGVSKRDDVRSEIDARAEEIRRIGVTIVRDVLSKDDVDYMRIKLLEIYQLQVADMGGEANLYAINDANIVRSPLAYDPIFKDLAKNPKILSVARACLGNNITLSSQVGIINKPKVNNYQEGWHRELQYQHFTSSRSLAIQGLLAVDDFTTENGGTFFLQGSHLFEHFPSDDFVRNWEVQYKVQAGSIIMFDAMVYHRGASNRTQHDRLAINNLYTLPIIQQQINLANMLGEASDLTPEELDLFGYTWNPAKDILTWRQQRLKGKTS